MQAGKLRHRLTIQKRSVVQNKYNETGDSWSHEATVWGAIRPLNVYEASEAAKMVGNVSHQITLRAPQIDVGPEKRIVFNDRVFEVVGQMDWDEEGEMLRVMAKETT